LVSLIYFRKAKKRGWEEAGSPKTRQLPSHPYLLGGEVDSDPFPDWRDLNWASLEAAPSTYVTPEGKEHGVSHPETPTSNSNWNVITTCLLLVHWKASTYCCAQPFITWLSLKRKAKIIFYLPPKQDFCPAAAPGQSFLSHWHWWDFAAYPQLLPPDTRLREKLLTGECLAW